VDGPAAGRVKCAELVDRMAARAADTVIKAATALRMRHAAPSKLEIGEIHQVSNLNTGSQAVFGPETVGSDDDDEP